jgi:hypothetical protein
MSLSSSSGAFVPITSSLDASEVGREPDVKKLMVRLYRELNNISTALNLKVTGYYSTKEYLCGKLFYPSNGTGSSVRGGVAYRPVFSTVVKCGTLPNATTKTVAHNLNTKGYTLVSCQGAATNPTGWTGINLPYLAGTGSSVSVWVDGTNVNLQTSGNMSAYTESHVVLEYVKT